MRETREFKGFVFLNHRQLTSILQYLEAELARVQAKMKQEEQETEKLFRTKTKSGGKDMFESMFPSLAPLPEYLCTDHLVYLWEKFVKDSDKKRLASYGIRSSQCIVFHFVALDAILF